mmetsp:Transcript_39659/g.95392  ORF Transcript_39659/g.95392 Transcript_39659/m.95392 type:complete len:228 (-) Transcript_39659:40-723(-)
MRENENLPPVLGGMSPKEIFEPGYLLPIDGHLVRNVRRIAKYRGTHAHQQRLAGHLPAELRRTLPVRLEVHIQIRLVRVELVQAFEVVIPPHDFVRHAIESGQVFRGEFVTGGRAREQFRIVIGIVFTIFGFAQIAQRDQGDSSLFFAALRFVEDGEEMRSPDNVIVHLSWIDVQIAEDADGVFITGCDYGIVERRRGRGGSRCGAIARAAADHGAGSRGNEGRCRG